MNSGISVHSLEDIDTTRMLPNMTVVMPADAWEAAQATKAIVRALRVRACVCQQRYALPGAPNEGTYGLS